MALINHQAIRICTTWTETKHSQRASSILMAGPIQSDRRVALSLVGERLRVSHLFTDHLGIKPKNGPLRRNGKVHSAISIPLPKS